MLLLNEWSVRLAVRREDWMSGPSASCLNEFCIDHFPWGT